MPGEGKRVLLVQGLTSQEHFDSSESEHISLRFPVSEYSNIHCVVNSKMRLVFLLLLFANLARYARGQCESYGLDFVNGGSYFIDNTLSTNFTFLSEFDGRISFLHGVP